MSAQSFGPFRVEILGGMDIDGDPRTGVFLSAEIPQLRGVGAMMGDDVVIARADLVQALVEALRECSDDLEAHTRAEYGWPAVHPAMAAKFQRDMDQVNAARAALRAIEGG